jgi:hypothetical protein
VSAGATPAPDEGAGTPVQVKVDRYVLDIYTSPEGCQAAVDLGPDRLTAIREGELAAAAVGAGASRLVVYVEGTCHTIDLDWHGGAS